MGDLRRRHHPPRSVVAGVLLLCVLALVPAPVWPDGALVSSLHPSAAGEIQKARALIAGGAIDEGVGELQELHEATLGGNFLIEVAAHSVEGEQRISASLTSFLLEQFRELRPAIEAAYRRQYDLTAEAFWDRALRSGTPDDLFEVHVRYPLATISAIAARAAGDAYLEAGLTVEAARAWSAAASAAPDQRRSLAGRWDALRGVLGSEASRRWARLGRIPSAGKKGAPPQTEGGEVEGGRGGAPPDPFGPGTSARLAWRAALLESGGGASRLPELLQAQPSKGFVTVSTPEALHTFLLPSGQELGESRYSGIEHYRETSTLSRLSSTTDGRHVVTTFVHRVDPQLGRGRRSGVVKAELPQRALAAFERRGNRWVPAWSTNGRGDLADLSFGPPAVIRAGRVYALAWGCAGYVDAHVVCLDLASGRLLWRTLLGSNQVELTRFGQLAAEPFLGGLLVEDGVVYASTNLGFLASVRATDGSLRWVTEYAPVRSALTIQQRRRLRFPYEPRIWWDAAPLVSADDRFLVTPQDSWYLFAVEKNTGRILQRRPIRRGVAYLLGRDEEGVVFVERQTSGHGVWIVQVRADDLRDTTFQNTFFEAPVGRPVLVEGAVILAARSGLHRVRLGEVGRPRVLYDASTAGDSLQEMPRGGLTAFSQGILLTGSEGIFCFRPEVVEPRRVGGGGGKRGKKER